MLRMVYIYIIATAFIINANEIHTILYSYSNEISRYGSFMHSYVILYVLYVAKYLQLVRTWKGIVIVFKGHANEIHTVP